MKNWRWYVLSLFIFWLICPAVCQAAVQTDGYKVLKEALEEPGEAQVILKGDIAVRGTIRVQGKKWIQGNGNVLKRGSVGGRIFGGTILSLESGRLVLSGVTISGGAGKAEKKGRIYGRLVEVKKGSFILGKGSALRDNRNSRRKEEGGGAALVYDKGRFLVRGGEISGNTTVTEGAAVLVKRGGYFQMKGGIIRGNKSSGIGRIEGFDGRGGAISNYGMAIITGGVIRDNKARGFAAGKSLYGGVGGMLYNRGNCVITGGTIEHNTASGGGAVYSDRHSILRVKGGKFQNNQADSGRTIFFCGKCCFLDLYLNDRELYVEKDSKIIKKGRRPEQEKPEEKPEKDKREKVIWQIGKKRIFYTGERVGRKELMYGIKARCRGRDVTDRVYLSRISGKAGIWNKSGVLFHTGERSRGKLYFSIQGNSIKNREFVVPYEVRENSVPRIRTAPRFLFTWEVRGYSEEQWKQLLWEGIVLTDREDNPKDLWQKAKFDWKNITDGEPGTYQVRVHIRDQWGNRFYMNHDETGKYGAGLEIEVEIPVTLVSERNAETLNRGVVHFLPVGKDAQNILEEWFFPSKLISDIRTCFHIYDNPFSEEANLDFLKRFGMAKK